MLNLRPPILRRDMKSFVKFVRTCYTLVTPALVNPLHNLHAPADAQYIRLDLEYSAA